MGEEHRFDAPAVAGRLATELRCPRGTVNVRDFDPDRTPLFSSTHPGHHDKGKEAGQEHARDFEVMLDDLQERLYAEGVSNGDAAPRVLLVLQGMDTSGKGGVVRHVIGQMDPQGVHIHAFKAPSEEERKHDFLWRIRRALPEPGHVGIFDRSQYEDVLIQRVEHMVPEEEIQQRYTRINEFERQLSREGVRIVKCFLDISNEEQKSRLAQRLEDPRKYWKYSPNDLPVRMKWEQYMDAYSLALSNCNEDWAPWFVIPANKKWYRNWAIAGLVANALASLNLTWPPARFDVAEQQAKVAAS
jgi:PPK2 family polyphosphate:nucleotide phosphotransferase